MKVLFGLGLSAVLLASCGGSTNTNDCTLGVNSCNVAPVANAGGNQTVLVGTAVTLDGTFSVDPNGDPLTYSWQVINRPASSSAVPNTSTSAKPTFVPDVPGIYLIGLTVNDGKLNSAQATSTITASLTNLTITSSSYSNGGSIPIRIAGPSVGGGNVSPQINITDVPPATGKYAIIMDDETGLCGTGLAACRHWGVFNLPSSKTAIAEGENLVTATNGVNLGTNYTGSVGYSGPANLGHTYKLTVYAMSKDQPNITIVPEYNRAQFERDFKDFILGKATWVGTYP